MNKIEKTLANCKRQLFPPLAFELALFFVVAVVFAMFMTMFFGAQVGLWREFTRFWSKNKATSHGVGFEYAHNNFLTKREAAAGALAIEFGVAFIVEIKIAWQIADGHKASHTIVGQ